MAITAWGKAKVVESITIEQSNEERAFTTHVELLEDEDGEEMVRFAYATEGVGRRGPVTLRRRDVDKMKRALRKTPRLSAALGFDGS